MTLLASPVSGWRDRGPLFVFFNLIIGPQSHSFKEGPDVSHVALKWLKPNKPKTKPFQKLQQPLGLMGLGVGSVSLEGKWF